MTTLDTAGTHRQLVQRLNTAVAASSERLAEEIVQAFASLEQHLQSPRRASWGADCEWVLSGLQNTSRTALDLLVFAGQRTRKESQAIQRRIMTTMHQARLQAQAAGDTVAPIVAASRIASLLARGEEDNAAIYKDLRDVRVRGHEPRQRAL